MVLTRASSRLKRSVITSAPLKTRRLLEAAPGLQVELLVGRNGALRAVFLYHVDTDGHWDARLLHDLGACHRLVIDVVLHIVYEEGEELSGPRRLRLGDGDFRPSSLFRIVHVFSFLCC